MEVSLTNKDISVSPEEAAKIIARRKIGLLTTGQLPIEPMTLVDMFMVGFLGDPHSAVIVIKEIARSEFDLVVNNDGYLDLPEAESRETGVKIQTRFKDLTPIQGIPPLSDKRPYRKTPDRKGGAE